MKMFSSKEADIAWARDVAKFAAEHDAPNTAAEIELAIKEYGSRKITVAVMGLNKRGKSTFCNALLGRKDDTLAPVDWMPATGVISTFSNSKEDACAFVRFEDGHQERIAYEQIKNYVLEEKNPENRKKVERVDVFGEFGLDDEITLIDLPGDDSIHAYHSQIVYQYLPMADVVLFLSSATDPIHKSELDLLSKIAVNDRRKIFFIINKVDDCDEEELEQAKAHNADVLANAGIQYEKQFFCISALEIMQSGKDNYDFQRLLDAIKDFLNENKLTLLREGFRNVVRQAVSGLQDKMELYAEACQLSENELKQKIENLKSGYSHSREVLEKGIDEFSASWEQMIRSLETQLPTLEEETKARVKNYINNIPMMSFNEKVLKALPEKISEIMEQVFATPLATTQEQVRSNLEKLEQNVTNIDHYLADHAIMPRRTSAVNYHGGSVVAGGTFIALGSALTSIATAPVAIVSGIPWIGGILGGIAGVATAPIALLATPLMAGGALFLALPVMSWIRGKKRQKTEILASAEDQITAAFCNIRTTKLPMMRQQGELLANRLKDSFREKMKQCQAGLNEALDRKALPSGDKMDVLKAEAACQCLSDLLNAPAE